MPSISDQPKTSAMRLDAFRKDNLLAQRAGLTSAPLHYLNMENIMTTNLYAPVVAKEDEHVILAVKMPKSLREQFKAHCAKFDLDMSVVLRRFMETEIAKEAGK